MTASAFRSGVSRRDEFMTKVPSWYRGEVHFIAVNVLGAAMIAIAAWGLHGVRASEWAVMPLAFLFANFFEWAVHRGPLHHKLVPEILYRRHTLLHHASFSHESMAVRDLRELRMVLFPAPLILAVGAIATAIAVAVGALWTPNAGRLVFVVLIGYYLLYEWCHLAYHLPANTRIARSRVVSFLRRTHQRHHDPSVMLKKNFNVTFPIADAILGTLDHG